MPGSGTIFYVQKSFKSIEPPCPDGAPLGDPGSCLVEGKGIKRQQVFPPEAAPTDQLRALQNANMFGDCIERHGERLSQRRHPFFSLRKSLEDGPPGRIGQGR